MGQFPQQLRALKHEDQLLPYFGPVTNSVKPTRAHAQILCESTVLHLAHLNSCGAARGQCNFAESICKLVSKNVTNIVFDLYYLGDMPDNRSAIH